MLIKQTTARKAEDKGFINYECLLDKWFHWNHPRVEQYKLQKWFRDTHNIVVEVCMRATGEWYVDIFDRNVMIATKVSETTLQKILFVAFDDYEEALEYGLVVALEDLPNLQ